MRNALRTQHIIYISSFAALFLGIANVFHAVILYHGIYYTHDVSYILTTFNTKILNKGLAQKLSKFEAFANEVQEDGPQ